MDSGASCKQKIMELFDCAICGQKGVPSSEEEPVGYVAFLQSGTGKSEEINHEPAKKFLMKLFSP